MYVVITEIQHCWNSEDTKVSFFMTYEEAILFIESFKAEEDHQYWFYLLPVDVEKSYSLDYGTDFTRYEKS